MQVIINYSVSNNNELYEICHTNVVGAYFYEQLYLTGNSIFYEQVDMK